MASAALKWYAHFHAQNEAASASIVKAGIDAYIRNSQSGTYEEEWSCAKGFSDAITENPELWQEGGWGKGAVGLDGLVQCLGNLAF